MIRIFIIDWIVESIKTYINTPHDKMDSDIKSSFWAAIAVIVSTVLTIALLAWFAKDMIDTIKEKRNQRLKDTDLDEFLRHDYKDLKGKPTLNGFSLNNNKKEDE